jgi:hypothetical protein
MVRRTGRSENPGPENNANQGRFQQASNLYFFQGKRSERIEARYWEFAWGTMPGRGWLGWLRNPVRVAVFDKSIAERLTTEPHAVDTFGLSENLPQGSDERITVPEDANGRSFFQREASGI